MPLLEELFKKYTSNKQEKVNFETLCNDIYLLIHKENPTKSEHSTFSEYLNSILAKSLQITFDYSLFSLMRFYFYEKHKNNTLISIEPVILLALTPLLYFLAYGHVNNRLTNVDMQLIRKIENSPTARLLVESEEAKAIVTQAMLQIREPIGNAYCFINTEIDIATLKKSLTK
ncbi:MAG: hypothetical protein WC748_01710 [Legionellales bacterium]|jgi:hypothetical protein